MIRCARCPVCEGSGSVPYREVHSGTITADHNVTCHACGGSGIVWPPTEIFLRLEENMTTENENENKDDLKNLINQLLVEPKMSTSQKVLRGVTSALFYTLAWTAMIVGIVSLARCAL